MGAVMVTGVSSSISVTVAEAAGLTGPTGEESRTRNDRLAPMVALLRSGMEMVLSAVSPAAQETVPEVAVKSTPAVAVSGWVA